MSSLQVLASDDFVAAAGTTGLYLVTGYDSNGYANDALLSTDILSVTSPVSYNYASYYTSEYTSVSYSSGIITVTNSTGSVAVSRALSSSPVIYFIDTTNAATTGTIVYQISGTQINALAGTTGYSVALVDASTTDTTVGTVYIMGSLT